MTFITNSQSVKAALIHQEDAFKALFKVYLTTGGNFVTDTHPRRCTPAPCKAQNLRCAGRERSGPAEPSASFASFACPFHRWPSCRPTTETSWSRYRSQACHLQGDEVSGDNVTANQCSVCPESCTKKKKKKREKEWKSTGRPSSFSSWAMSATMSSTLSGTMLHCSPCGHIDIRSFHSFSILSYILTQA